MRVCFIGDIVASPGLRVVKEVLPNYLKNNNIDFCVANAENIAGGLGYSSKFNNDLFNAGIDVITLGNHAFSRADFASTANNDSRIIRPSNVNPEWPGYDYAIVKKEVNINNKKQTIQFAVLNLIGQVNIVPTGSNPFRAADKLLEKVQGSNVIILDFHAEATSEKIAMGYWLAGKASLVVGTHTHVQTADEKILLNHTGYITDAGMTGCANSVLGMDVECSLRRLKDQLPAKYEPAHGEAQMSGIIADIDMYGKCLSIKRFSEFE